MKYLSLFSGIGGFEVAIHNIWPGAQCIGHSEVDKFALKVYAAHFPSHENLGDIRGITEETIRARIEQFGGCDLVVGSIPCQNLSSMARQRNDTSGLEGAASGLFFELVRILKIVRKYSKAHVIVESAASLRAAHRDRIRTELQSAGTPIHQYLLDCEDFGVQSRRCLYWTSFEISLKQVRRTQEWDDVLLPPTECTHFVSEQFERTMDKTLKNGQSRWAAGYHSETYKRCTPITRHPSAPNQVVIDTRIGRNRYFETREAERLFFLPDGYVGDHCSWTRTFALLGHATAVKVAEFLIRSLRADDFPWEVYTELELKEDFDKFKTYVNSNKLDTTLKKIGYKCTNHFFDHERLSTRTLRNKSAVEFWADRREYVLDYCAQVQRKKTSNVIAHLAHAPAQFNPSIAAYIYRRFNAKRILDPFAGWGNRCLAAMALNLFYIGVDSNKNLVKPYKEMIDMFGTGDQHFVCSPVEKLDIARYDIDMVFTSPPFWNDEKVLVENYHGMPKYTMREFIDQVLSKIFDLKCKFICLHLPSHMYAALGRTADEIFEFKSGCPDGEMSNNYVYCFRGRDGSDVN